MIKIYHRDQQKYIYETQYGEKYLMFLYGTILGRILLKGISHPFFSKLNGFYNDSRKSQTKITPFIDRYGISLDDFEQKTYKSFNDFFVRKHRRGKRPITSDVNQLIAPADSKLLVASITKDLKISVKNSVYSLEGLLQDNELAKTYEQGVCLIYRLTVDDCHRYCYIEDGNIEKRKKIDGKLHTVSSISEKYKVFIENRREYCLIKTQNMGEIVQMEVGAMLVGKIENNSSLKAIRGNEKGYFKYGGSTIIVLIKADQVLIDEDILDNSKMFIETKVKYGETVGVIRC